MAKMKAVKGVRSKSVERRLAEQKAQKAGIANRDPRPATTDFKDRSLPPDREAELVRDLRKTLGDYLLFGNGTERRFSRVIDIMDELDGRSYRENSDASFPRHNNEHQP